MSSTLKVDILQDSGGNNLVTSNGSGVITAAGFGKIGQVVQTVFNTNLNVTVNNTYAQITGLNRTITPTSTSSKILYEVSVSVGADNNSPYPMFRITKDGTAISGAYGTTGGNRKQVSFGIGHLLDSTSQTTIASFQYLDSPASTSQLTYGLQATGFSNRTFRINESAVNDGNAGMRAVSTLTLMEVLP